MENEPITEKLILELDFEKVKKALTLQFEAVCSATYDSPIRRAIEASMKENEGAIKKMIDAIIEKALSTDDFKEQVSKIVMTRLVESALKKY